MTDHAKKHDASSDDLKKRVRDGESPVKTTRRGTERSTAILSDISDAISVGLRAYSKTLNDENSRRRSLNQSMWEATLEGLSQFYQRMSESAAETLKQTRRDDEEYRMAVSAESIDYERLAKLVAAELANRSVTSSRS
jgi:hypothetical protein